MIWGRGAEGLRNSLAELKGRAQGDGAAGWDMTAKERMKKIRRFRLGQVAVREKTEEEELAGEGSFMNLTATVSSMLPPKR